MLACVVLGWRKGSCCDPRPASATVKIHWRLSMGAGRFLFPAVLTLLAGSVSAQVTGRISGSVTDSSGAAVPGATVNLLLPGGSKPILTTVTTSEGLFSVTNVRPESYDLTVDAKGFLKYTLRGVKVDPARETSLPKV